MTLTQNQIQIVHRPAKDVPWLLYGDHPDISIAAYPTIDECLEYAKGIAALHAEWRFLLIDGGGARPAPTMTALARVKRMRFESAGRTLARGSFNTVWPVFESYARML